MHMKYTELKKAAAWYAPAFNLERIFPRKQRATIKFLLGVCIALLLVFAFFAYVSGRVPGHAGSDIAFILAPYIHRSAGAAITMLYFWLILFMLDSFYYSYYFSGLDTVVAEDPHTLRMPVRSYERRISYELADIVYHAGPDITRGFLASPQGVEILLRSDVPLERVEQFLMHKQHDLSGEALEINPPTIDMPGTSSNVDLIAGSTIAQESAIPHERYMPGIADLAKAILAADKEFGDFLFSSGVKPEDYHAAAAWYERTLMLRKRRKRRWSRENLGRIPSIGRDWTYGRAYSLEKFATALYDLPVFHSADTSSPRGYDEMRQLEAVLARTREANAILVGPEGSGEMEIIARLGKEIEEGTILPALEHRQIMVFDGQGLVASAEEKGAFERALVKIFNDSIRAGNIIMAIPNLPGLMASARAIGSDVPSLLDPYLDSSALQVIATADPDAYYQTIEKNPTLAKRFEKIQIKGTDFEGAIRVLEDTADFYELRSPVIFTYPALKVIAESADRYFPSGVMPDKAIDLLVELMPHAEQSQDSIIDAKDVLVLVESKTGIPLGEVEGAERDTLLNLETILHDRVVGQDEAVQAIASSMRRSRTGVRNPDRPMGSFLFLGPTGVGKTETAKALADLFFGDEKAMLRLDMSEYTGPEALGKLIGSFDLGKAGTLATMLKEKPYGVLLIDEFEKTSSEVKDLFLQVLDEGVFSDMSGKRINARNVIIIATSNAGAQEIWNYFQKGEDVTVHKDEFVDAIIKNGLFKPELLNRFDGVIIFHPLDPESLAKIARLMLARLAKRLREKGIDFVVSDALVSHVVTYGADPEFGARPMNRAIQEEIEQLVAEKMIRGEAHVGSRIELTEADLAKK